MNQHLRGDEIAVPQRSAAGERWTIRSVYLRSAARPPRCNPKHGHVNHLKQSHEKSFQADTGRHTKIKSIVKHAIRKTRGESLSKAGEAVKKRFTPFKIQKSRPIPTLMRLGCSTGRARDTLRPPPPTPPPLPSTNTYLTESV